MSRGSWSKYGEGAKRMSESKGDWICQSCASTFTEDFERLPYAFNGKDEIAVCKECLEKNCEHITIRLKTTITTYYI